MDDMALFNQPEEKLMTTKELSQVLSVSIDTIQRTANKLFNPSAVLRRGINGGNSKVFTEHQATLIKQEIQKRHNLQSRQIDLVSTEEEENQTIFTAMSILKRRADSFKIRAENAEKQLKEQAPKVEFYEKVTKSDDTIDMSEVAKILNLGIGRNKIFEILREKNILNRYNEPYQQFVNAGLFKTVESESMDKQGICHINIKTVVFQKGLDYIRKILKNK